MSARSDILGRLQGPPGEGSDPFQQSPAERIASPDPVLGEAIAQRIKDPVGHFKCRFEAARGRVHEVDALEALPQTLAQLLGEAGCAKDIAVDPALAPLGWEAAGLSILSEANEWTRDPLSTATRALCGVAETGTLVCASSPGHDPRLDFLAHRHFVVLRSAEIFTTYEQAWAELRRLKRWPRAVHFITGPSKTADIEQTIEYGAHGPAHLHAILVKS